MHTRHRWGARIQRASFGELQFIKGPFTQLWRTFASLPRGSSYGHGHPSSLLSVSNVFYLWWLFGPNIIRLLGPVLPIWLILLLIPIENPSPGSPKICQKCNAQYWNTIVKCFSQCFNTHHPILYSQLSAHIIITKMEMRLWTKGGTPLPKGLVLPFGFLKIKFAYTHIQIYFNVSLTDWFPGYAAGFTLKNKSSESLML